MPDTTKASINQNLEKQMKTDRWINTAMHIPLAAQILLPLGEMLTKYQNSAVAKSFFSENDMMPLTPRALIGLGIAALGTYLKAANDFKIREIAETNEKKMMNTEAYTIIRHPCYASMRIMGAGFLVMWPTWYTAFAYTAFFGITEYLARREEKTCLLKFGEQYINYMEKTPRWIPKSLTKPIKNLFSMLKIYVSK
ncbi:hypothetical protein AYK26_03115 [Euryarchaeota archaeon SM23-78]|nr:MAG: hypothetical protein AYK26_03115 [Euryarchaeota archaeon SM23-78]MBW3000435.1 isoprenylcysteine carboxylmethyltransferase family protein [Candidatus Woesearchaeota archaeon]